MAVKTSKRKKLTQTPKRSPVPAVFMILESESISREHLKQVKDKLKQSSNSELYLVIRSYGGDAYSAVRMIRYIRTVYKNVVGVIPDYVYSAATLLLLGTNKILVAPEAYVGPLDKPIEHSQTGDPISALDITTSISNISALVSVQARSYYDDLRNPKNYETISKKDALDIAWKSSIDLLKPLVDKIDPVLLQKAYRDLKISLYYGIDLLTECMLLPFEKALDVASRLTNVYPSHSYAIFRGEMKNMGLNVENLEDSKDKDKILEIYNKTQRGIIFMEDIYA